MKISLGSDHAGFRYKEKVKELLVSLGHEVKDCGTFSEEPVDYQLFIRPAAEAVARGECDRGIVFGGSGNGEAMAAAGLSSNSAELDSAISLKRFLAAAAVAPHLAGLVDALRQPSAAPM